MGGRVLIVAGTVEAARPFEAILRPVFDIAVATRPEDALVITRRGTCDLVVLDCTVPGFDAVALCQRVKEAAPAVAVLAASLVGEPLQRLRALDAGADECLSWPAAPSTLLLRAHSLVRAVALAAEAGRVRALAGLDSHIGLVDPAQIVILDPCEWSRTRLAAILATLGEVSAFAEPGAGLIGAAEGNPDLALVSLDWADRAGIDLVRQLRIVTSEKEPAVLALADRDDLPARLCLEAGIDDRLLRPIDRCEAVLRARLALQKAKLSAILREEAAAAPLPEPHRLNRPAHRRPPPQRYAA